MTPNLLSHPSSPRPADPAAAALPNTPRDALRTAIDTAWRTPEPVCVPVLVEAARIPSELREPVRSLAHSLVSGLRATRTRSSGVDALMKEFVAKRDELGYAAVQKEATRQMIAAKERLGLL